MGKVKQGHLAVYGSIKIRRLFCEKCDDISLIVKGKYVCCGSETKETPEFWKRESEADANRSRPSRAAQQEILLRQDDRCLYCERLFGSWARRNGKPLQLSVCWDHFAPYSYSRDNQDLNFVAACQVCNGIKSNRIFETIEQARVYLSTCGRRFDDE